MTAPGALLPRLWKRRTATLAWSLAFLFVGACSPDRPPDAREAAPSAAPGPDSRSSFGTDDAEPVSLLLFDEVPDLVLERRLTLHLLAQEPAGRAEFSRTLRALLPERAASDSALVAIRAIVYQAVVREGENEGNLVPVAWGEWIPVEGWHGEVGEGRGTGHRVYFYHGAPPEW